MSVPLKHPPPDGKSCEIAGIIAARGQIEAGAASPTAVSGPGPLSGLDVELHFPGGAHSHELILQRVGAFAAGIQSLLQWVHRERLVERRHYVIFRDHCRSFRANWRDNSMLGWRIL
jgi:hypothetical protein